MNYIFFGAGNIGKSIIELCMNHIENLLFFVDNNSQLWETDYKKIPIYSPNIIKIQEENYIIIITCANTNDIYTQLIEMGISKNIIVIWTEFLTKKLVDIWNSEKQYNCKSTIHPPVIPSPLRVLIDLQKGLVLGGVESWVFQISKLFRSWKIDTKYLISNTSKQLIANEISNSIEIDLASKTIGEMIKLSSKIMRTNTPCTIICNFVSFFFWGACYIKHQNPFNVNLVTVIHSDTDLYYNSYTIMERYIDFCIVISKKMKLKLLELGFPKEKIRYLTWSIPCNDLLIRNYSIEDQKLNIGYAGRITIADKRCDLLWEIILKLRKMNINFNFEIAGDGDYLDELKSLIKKKDLSDKVHLLGFIPREQISSFWKRQDIMIGCSDVEGHSISQAEAMASGAVPIITDTSGARDDIIDSKNGFIVQIGNSDMIVAKICYLYHHREQLHIMGECAHKSIVEKNTIFNKEKFWQEILKIRKEI